jgi:hypothetical protein
VRISKKRFSITSRISGHTKTGGMEERKREERKKFLST